MNIIIFIVLILLNQIIYASKIAIAESFQASPLHVYCLNENLWENHCQETETTALGHYDFLFKRLDDTIAFGFNHDMATMIAACKNDGDLTWYDCSPKPELNYLSAIAMNDKNEFLIIGIGAEGELLATCMNAKQQSQNCSPTQNTHGFYTQGAIAYGNNTWTIFGGTREWLNGHTIIPAFCLNDQHKTWQACDVVLDDPDQSQYHSIFAFQALQYLPHEKRYVAAGMGGKNLFKSICKDENADIWQDCTEGEFPSAGVKRLIQNAKGDLLQINVVSHFTPDDYLLSSQILCRKANQSWQDCTGSIKNVFKDIYVSAIFDEVQQKWMLIGNHKENNQNTFLTAIQDENDWQIKRQDILTGSYSLTDVL